MQVFTVKSGGQIQWPIGSEGLSQPSLTWDLWIDFRGSVNSGGEEITT